MPAPMQETKQLLCLWLIAAQPQRLPTPPADASAKMRALLEAISKDANHEFLGDANVKALRAALASLPSPDTHPTPESMRLLYDLGFHELRLGNNEKAVEHLLTAYNLVPRMRERIPPTAPRAITFSLAVAYMRWGETQNCVAMHTSQSCIFPIEGSGVHKNQTGARKAIQYFTEILDHDPNDLTSRWLLNIAYMTVGGYPQDVPAAYLIEPKAFASDEPFPRFVDVAPHLALNTVNLCGGAIADDFDDDGLLDIVTSTWDTAGSIRYFRNDGDGKFTDRTQGAGLTGIFGGLNIIQADYNNDGHTDVLVLRGAWLGDAGHHPNSLLRNNGDGTFTDVTFDAGLAKVHYPTQTASWGDYDNDGDLDLYIGNERAPAQLFRNNGDATFTDVANQAGVTNDRFAKGVVWGDYDGDRYPDLYVSNLCLLLVV